MLRRIVSDGNRPNLSEGVTSTALGFLPNDIGFIPSDLGLSPPDAGTANEPSDVDPVRRQILFLVCEYVQQRSEWHCPRIDDAIHHATVREEAVEALTSMSDGLEIQFGPVDLSEKNLYRDDIDAQKMMMLFHEIFSRYGVSWSVIGYLFTVVAGLVREYRHRRNSQGIIIDIIDAAAVYIHDNLLTWAVDDETDMEKYAEHERDGFWQVRNFLRLVAGPRPHHFVEGFSV